ncbi:MAG: hypothetical protein LC725_01755 [Lentisphaerae bacterium]|nr:hypothetical protein [Lentisphaerota bacterium]
MCANSAPAPGPPSAISYIPDPNVRDLDFIRSGQISVRICPEVNRNAFVPGHREFKGFRDETRSGYAVAEADFEQSYLKLDDEGVDYGEDDPDIVDPQPGKIRFDAWFTTYGMNRVSKFTVSGPSRLGPYERSRGDIPDNIIAFICWNAEEGWGAHINRTTPATWAYNGQDRYGNPVKQDDSKLALKGTTDWWRTEIGFYHPGIGTNMTANYVAMDGSVGSISYADISFTNFTWAP